MAKLYMLMGIPGSGKSTWIRQHINPDKEKYVSRDEIRFSFLDAYGGDYFTHEKEVFIAFIDEIKMYLAQDFNVYADATHITKASRNKLIRGLSHYPDEINVIWIKTPYEQCLLNNAKRTGREFVPLDAMERMKSQIETPEFEEGFKQIITVTSAGIEIREEIK